MKRLIAILLIVASLTAMLAACGSKPNDTVNPAPTAGETTPAVNVDPQDLADALEYLRTIYKEVEEKTPSDFQRVNVLRIGGVEYPVTWTTDADESAVKIVDNGNGTVTVDVNDQNDEELVYALTATLTDAAGNVQTFSWSHILPGTGVDPEEMKAIIDQAYALEKGAVLDGEYTLAGEIISIDTAWSDQYKNITVIISCEGREDKPIMCYRLKGDGAQDLAIGDFITVFGVLKNYNGTIEFDAGCQLLSVIKGDGEPLEVPTNPKEIMEQARALKVGMSLPYDVTLTGRISDVDTAYSDQYKNISVTIEVDGAPGHTILCYRLKGDGANTLNVNDIITVTGQIKNYAGTIEFNYPTLDAVTQKAPPTQPEDPCAVVDAAYALRRNKTLPYTVTLTGTVTSVDTSWSDQYKNVTITFVVEGREDKPIKCYRLKGDGAAIIQRGDIIIVQGIIKNYVDKSGKSTIEFDTGCKILNMWKGTDDYVSTDPTPNTEMSIADAIVLGLSKDHNCYTEGKYYVTGEITEIYNTTYGNMRITDTAGNILTVYGTWSADGSTRFDKLENPPVVGDTVTVYGIIGQYNGTPQLKNGWIVTEIPDTPVVPDTPTVEDPTPDSTLSIADVIALGSSKPHDTYTSGKYYVTGTITEVYNTQYGNMRITDAAGNILTVYGTYDASGANRYDAMEVKPVAGDTVTVYGIIGQYNGTPQIKNGWITQHTPAGSEKPEEPEVPEVPADPEAGSTLTIAEVLALGASKEHNVYTTGKYYVTGTITEVYNTQYGNMRISDAAGNILTIYGTFDASGANRYDAMEVKPVAGDTVTVYGIVGQYNGTPQVKNGWIVNHVSSGEPEEPEVPEEPEEPEVPEVPAEPAAGSTLSISEVLALGASKEHNTYTAGKYYVTGTIVEVYNTQYGNMRIQDAAGNILTIYGTYDASGANRYDAMEVQPTVGDTVTIYGIVGQYNGTPQVKNGWIVSM